MHTRFLFVLFSCCLLLSSCIITNTPGFYSGYKKLTPQQKEKVVFVDTNRHTALPQYDENKLVAITANHLHELLQKNDTSVVYVWKPHCPAPSCLPLSTVYDYCQQHRYQLYVVLEYYSDMDNTLLQISERYHVYSINYKYYKTDYCPKYVNRFVKQMVKGYKIPKSADYFRYYFFKQDRYIGSKEKLNG